MTSLDTYRDRVMSGSSGGLDSMRDRVMGDRQAPDANRLPWELLADSVERRNLENLATDEGWLDIAQSSFGRGTGGMIQSLGGLQQFAVSAGEKLFGKNAITQELNRRARETEAMGRVLRGLVPRPPDETRTQRYFGDVLEGLPQFGAQVSAAFLTGGGSVLAQIAIFVGTGALPVVGDQYLESLRATGDPDTAMMEATAAGLITTATNMVPGTFLFARIPGANRLLVSAALRVAARMVGGHVGESVQELSEGVLTEFAASLIRQDPSLAKRVLDGDPEFWSPLFREALAAGTLGGGAGLSLQVVTEIDAKLKAGKALKDEDLQIARQVLELTKPDQVQQQTEPAAPTVEDFTPAEAQLALAEGPDLLGGTLTEAERAATQELLEGLRARAEAEPTTEPQAEPETRQQQQDRVRQKIHEIVFGKAETVMETTELLEELQRVKEAGRQAIRAARRKGQDETRAVFEARLERVRTRVADIEQLRTELTEAVTERFGGTVPKNLLQRLNKLKTQKGLDSALRQVDKEVAKLERREAIGDLRKTIKGMDRKKLGPAVQEAVGLLLDDVAVVGLSDAQRTELESIRSALEGVDQELPTRLEKRLERLEKTEIKDLSTEDVRLLTYALGALLAGNARVQQARRNAQAQRSDAAQARMSREIAQTVKPQPETPEGRLRKDSRAGLIDLMVGSIPNMTVDSLAEKLGGSQDSMTWRVLYDAVDQSLDNAEDASYAMEDMLRDGLTALGLRWGGRAMARMSAEIADPRNLLARVMKSLGSRRDFRTSADIITYTLENGTTLKLDRGQRMALLATLRRRRSRNQILYDHVPVKLRSNRTRPFLLSPADARMIETTMPGINSVELDGQVLDLMMDIINGPARNLIRQWSLMDRGYDITSVDDVYYMTHRETGKTPTLSGSAFRRSVLESMGIVQPVVPRSDAAYLIGDAFKDSLSYFRQSAILTQAGPAIQFAHQSMHGPKVAPILDNSRGGRRMMARFDATFEQLAQDAGVGPPMRGVAEESLRPIIERAQVGALALNPWVAMYQVISYAYLGLGDPGGDRSIKPGYLLMALMQGAPLNFRINKRMHTYGWLRRRNMGSNLGLMQEGGSLGRQLLGKRGGLGEMLMAPIRIMDMMVMRTAWRAAEMQAGKDVTRTRTLVGTSVKRTQPTFDTWHLSYIGLEAKQGAAFKLGLSMFRAQTAKIVDMVHRGIMRRDPRTPIVLMLGAFLLAAIRELRDRVRGKKTKESLLARLGHGTMNAILGVPVLGDFAAYIYNRAFGRKAFDPQNLVAGMFMDVAMYTAAARRGWLDDDNRKMWRAAIKAFVEVASLNGVPLRSLYRDLEPYLFPEEERGRRRSD